MNAEFIRQRLTLAVGRLRRTDVLRLNSAAGVCAVELIRLFDDTDVYAVYNDAKPRRIEIAGAFNTLARKQAIARVVEYLLEKQVTLDGIHSDLGGSTSFLWRVPVKQVPMNGTAAWVFNGSPYTSALKTVHLRPMERNHEAVKSKGGVAAIRVTEPDRDSGELKPHTWLQRGGIYYAMGARGKEFAGFIQLRRIHLMSLSEIPFPLLRAAGYANALHLQIEWANEYKDYRRSRPVWGLEFTPLSHAAVTAAPQVAPVADNYSDLPLFRLAALAG